MSTDRTPVPSVVARRPPAPSGDLATVTRLLAGGDEREVVPVAAIDGSLALEVPAPSVVPPAPDLRLLDGGGSREHREVQAWAARFAQATVEVLGGDRPVSQLLRWTTARVYQDLDRRVRPQVRSVHVFQPQPGTAEVSVHVRHGHRSRALAARLERRKGRWTCVALQLG